MRPGMGAEVDAEDLFNMFFGGGMGNGPFGATPVFTFGGPGMRTHYYRPGGAGARARQAGAQAAQQNQTAMWFQVLPLLILLFFTLLSYLPNLFMVSDPDFRWRPTPMHRAQRTTLDRGISYYVDPVAFAKHPYVKATTTSSGHGGNVQRFSREKSSPELRGFERRVEEAWMKELYRQCDSALEHKRRRMMDAQGFFGIGVRVCYLPRPIRQRCSGFRLKCMKNVNSLKTFLALVCGRYVAHQHCAGYIAWTLFTFLPLCPIQPGSWRSEGFTHVIRTFFFLCSRISLVLVCHDSQRRDRDTRQDWIAAVLQCMRKFAGFAQQ